MLDHAVEGQSQRADFVVVALDIHLRLEVAFRDAFGRADQARNRPHQAVGGPQAKPDRRQQDDERDHAVKRREEELDARKVFSQTFVFVGRDFGALIVIEHRRIDLAHDQQVSILKCAQMNQRAHGSHFGIGIDEDDTLGCLSNLTRCGRLGIGHVLLLGTAQHHPMAVDDVGRLQPVIPGLQLGEHQPEVNLVLLQVEDARIVLDPGRNFAGVHRDATSPLQNILARHVLGAVERRLHARGEPCLDAEIESHRRENRDQDRRYHGDDAEHHHQTHMQLGARPARAPFAP